ncbi:MAG: VPLPA-CTERM sorting domain-containing protein [Candidatus Binataceae bacterium]
MARVDEQQRTVVALGVGSYHQHGNQTSINGLSISNIPVAGWSDTQWAVNGNSAWYFAFYVGVHANVYKASHLGVWANLPGDSTPFPIPESSWLLMSGIIGTGMFARRMRMRQK